MAAVINLLNLQVSKELTRTTFQRSSLSLYLPQSLHSHSLCLCTSHSLCTPILFVFLSPTVSALPFSLSFYLPQSLHSHSLCLSTSHSLCHSLVSHSIILPAFTPCSSPPSIP